MRRATLEELESSDRGEKKEKANKGNINIY